MREPYETLLGQYHDHWSLGQHLQSELPNWEKIYDSPIIDGLSSGERVMVNVALAIFNNDPGARIADIAKVDRENQRRILDALEIVINR